MICSLFDFVHSLVSPVAAGRLGWGLVPPDKAASPQMETWNTINQYSFHQFLECQPPRTNTKYPYLKLSSNGSETVDYSSFVHKNPNITQMK